MIYLIIKLPLNKCYEYQEDKRHINKNIERIKLTILRPIHINN